MSPATRGSDLGRRFPDFLYVTGAAPVRDRWAHWRDALSRTSSGAGTGTVRTYRLGPLRVSAVEGGPARILRPARPVEPGQGEELAVIAPVEGVTAVEQDGGRVRVRPGEVVFRDLARPVRMDYLSGLSPRPPLSPLSPFRPFRTDCLVMPRGLLGLTEPDTGRLTAATVRPDTAPGALLAQLPARLVDSAAALSPDSAGTLARHVVDLLSVLAEEWLHQQAADVPGTGHDLLPRVKDHIDRHLADPGLSPESVARAHGISVRYLHRLFEGEDVTVGRWIQRRRLQECRRELARHRTAGRTIAAVARQWGFPSAPHFSRAFRSLYGMSPAEWRDFTLPAPRARLVPAPDRVVIAGGPYGAVPSLRAPGTGLPAVAAGSGNEAA